MQETNVRLYTFGEVVDRLEKGECAIKVVKGDFGVSPVGQKLYIRDGILKCNGLPVHVDMSCTGDKIVPSWMIIKK